ncbi:MAG: YqgE/AlgH family protein [Bryobacterales bacterium]|nr:YqgE/AlgH family protein [Bryobacterales bacterium]
MRLWLCVLLGMAETFGQSAASHDLAAGKLLVASRKLGDPNFAETVIVIVSFDEKGTLGLVLNQPTQLPLSRIFSDLKGGKERTDTAYRGGPVERTDLQALLRSKIAPGGAVHVIGDVYLTSSRTLVAKSLAEGSGPARFRVYLGYAGWAPEQLEHEVESGAWHVLRGEPDLVFDPDPESLWTRMIRRTEMRFASAAGRR